jgi:hypothetical protein
MLALLLPQVWLETGYGRSSAFAQSKREHGSRTPHKRSSNSEPESAGKKVEMYWWPVKSVFSRLRPFTHQVKELLSRSVSSLWVIGQEPKIDGVCNHIKSGGYVSC